MNRALPYITVIVCSAWAALAFGLGNPQPPLATRTLEKAPVNAWFPPFYSPRDIRPRCNVLIVSDGLNHYAVNPHELPACEMAYCSWAMDVPWVQAWRSVPCAAPNQNECDGQLWVYPVGMQEVYCDEINHCDWVTVDCSEVVCAEPDEGCM